MNKTLKKWLLAGDESKADLFNARYRCKRENEKIEITRWLDTERYETFRLKRIISLHHWLTKEGIASVPPSRDAAKSIYSVAFSIFKNERNGGRQ